MKIPISLPSIIYAQALPWPGLAPSRSPMGQRGYPAQIRTTYGCLPERLRAAPATTVYGSIPRSTTPEKSCLIRAQAAIEEDQLFGEGRFYPAPQGPTYGMLSSHRTLATSCRAIECMHSLCSSNAPADSFEICPGHYLNPMICHWPRLKHEAHLIW